jgi:hypothetical protein
LFLILSDEGWWSYFTAYTNITLAPVDSTEQASREQDELGAERRVTNDGHAAKQCLSPVVMKERGTARVRSTAIAIFIPYVSQHMKNISNLSLTALNIMDSRFTNGHSVLHYEELTPSVIRV